jgi:hypothetical protein
MIRDGESKMSKTVNATLVRNGKTFSTRAPRGDANALTRWARLHFPGWHRIIVPSLGIDVPV